MIANEREYRITNAAAKKFVEALKNFDNKSATQSGAHLRLIKAEKEGIASQLATLRKEMHEYERLLAERDKTVYPIQK